MSMCTNYEFIIGAKYMSTLTGRVYTLLAVDNYMCHFRDEYGQVIKYSQFYAMKFERLDEDE